MVHAVKTEGGKGEVIHKRLYVFPVYQTPFKSGQKSGIEGYGNIGAILLMIYGIGSVETI